MKALKSSAKATRTALVAGGAGFLGSHLCDRLLETGHAVVCVDSFLTGSPANVAHLAGNSAFTLLRHDVCSPLPDGLSADVVFNLACAASPPRYQADPIHTLMTSVLGTKHLLDLSARTSARFVQASTSEVYGDPEHHPQRESYFGNVNPTGPRACYDEGKRAAEALIFDHLRLGRVDARVARIFNTYGPRMDPADGRIVSNLVCQALSAQPLTIYGDGSQTRSFCFVSDLIDGLLALAQVGANPSAPVNLGNPGEFSITDLADLVRRLVPGAGPIVHRPLPADDPQRRRPDISRARDLLDWAPRVSLAEGLPRTIAWFAGRLAADRGQNRPAARAGRRPNALAAAAGPAG